MVLQKKRSWEPNCQLDLEGKNNELELEKILLEMAHLDLDRARVDLYSKQRRMDTNDAIINWNHIGGYIV